MRVPFPLLPRLEFHQTPYSHTGAECMPVLEPVVITAWVPIAMPPDVA